VQGAVRHRPVMERRGQIVALIREILATSPFHSEGHRKVRVRLRQRGVHIGKGRALRLMRAHGLLAPTRPGHVHYQGVRYAFGLVALPPIAGQHCSLPKLH
jgi:hypothetical protein